MKNKIFLLILLPILLLTNGCYKQEDKIKSDNSQNIIIQKDFITKYFRCDELSIDNIKDINKNWAITNDGELYQINFNQIYSNEMNCKKINTNILISKILGDNFFEDKNKNKYYYKDSDIFIKGTLREEGYYVFGGILQRFYDYGIYQINDDMTNVNGNIIKVVENQVIQTDNAIYYRTIINKNECEKYADVECKYGFINSVF